MSRTAVFAACSELPEGDGDEQSVLPALGELGFSVRWAAWDDPAVDFAAADVVVLRATWDYSTRRAEFLDWCESVPGLCNPVAVARWNTDKSYLVELAGAGLPVVPTSLIEVGDDVRWPRGDFVVKPSVGAGSRGAARFAAGDTEAAAKHLAALHTDGHRGLLQPYQSSVDTEGETALVYFGGIYSHAFTKAAMLGSTMDESGLYVSEQLGSVEPAADLRALAEDALDTATGLLGMLRAELLYARVDVVRGEDGRPVVLELELTEPSLGFRQADPGAALRFASAVRQQLA